jgi:TrpR family trp operon transcriptional repressor
MKESIDSGWQQLLDWCMHVEDEQQLSSLFELLLTPEEKVDIAKRCLIIRELLAKNHSQREISKNLNVSIAKITRGSNEIKRLSPEILQFIQKNSK